MAAPAKSQLVADRAKYIGYNNELNYSDSPLVIMRGEREFLYDEHGHEYLDCVNNVCHVGHCHPKVVAAAQEQIATLNTNNRYLHPALIEYAKELTATLPSPLQVVYFVNSGSEANDLALRLARAHTGKRGILCAGGAYHGHTWSVIEMSPYKYAREGGAGRRNFVKEFPQPDVFSGPHRGDMEDDAMGAAYAGEVAAKLESFAADEKAEAAWRAARAAAQTPSSTGTAEGAGASSSPAASADWAASYYGEDPVDASLTAGCGMFIMESILSCGGQVVPPKGFLKRAYDAVRAHGGICVADEVQVGFGRVGDAFWAFQLQGADVVPDVVTIGKPMANGMPMAAVITTPEIAASFNNGMQYFNTFGGNPVVAAAARATLAVIREERLQERAVAVGKVLLDGFHALQAKHPESIGSVRGVGMMVGLEFLADRTSRTPGTAAAKKVKYAMLARRILVSTDGMEDNIVKLKPPMVFSVEDAARVVKELGEVLQELGL